MGQTHKEYGGLKHVCERSTLLLNWNSGVAVLHKNKLLKPVEKDLTHQSDTNRKPSN